MKVILQINSMKNGSTGTIMNGLAKEGRRRGYKMYTSSAGNLYQRGLKTENPEFHLYIGGILENKLHKTLGSIFGGGCYSQIGTYLFLKKIDKIKPDVIHIHNLHSNYINLKMLFRYIRKKQIPVIWTLHDCWAFTGHCPHFEAVKCSKWKERCFQCPQHRNYPESYLDDSAYMYHVKKEIFSGIQNMLIVTPSEWLAALVKQSFLKDYPVKVVHNGISLSVFQRKQGNFRKKYKIPQDKKIVLGVSFSWSFKKGLDVFEKLSERLTLDRYCIVLVGTNDKIDQQLSDRIISIHHTDSQTELAEIYASADVFVNPTREDTFPTVNMEALACGVPVVTFNTGGSPEVLDESCGAVIEKEDINGMLQAIERLAHASEISELCVKRAEKFSLQQSQREYMDLYETVFATKI